MEALLALPRMGAKALFLLEATRMTRTMEITSLTQGLVDVTSVATREQLSRAVIRNLTSPMLLLLETVKFHLIQRMEEMLAISGEKVKKN